MGAPRGGGRTAGPAAPQPRPTVLLLGRARLPLAPHPPARVRWAGRRAGRRAGRGDSRLSPSPSLTPATARALALTLTVTLIRVGLVVVLLTDYVITIEAATRGAPSLRFGRPLRGLLVLFVDRAVQHCIQAVRRRMHPPLCAPALHPRSAPLLCTPALHPRSAPLLCTPLCAPALRPCSAPLLCTPALPPALRPCSAPLLCAPALHPCSAPPLWTQAPTAVWGRAPAARPAAAAAPPPPYRTAGPADGARAA